MSFRDEMLRREWICRGPNKIATHLLLDGGKLCVPEDQEGAFINIYFNHILKSENLSVVEIKTPIFKMFVDLDIKLPREGPAIDAARMLEVVRESAADFWECDDLPKMLVATADPKILGELVKTGFHLHFPDIFVNAPIAIKFRETLLENLENAMEGFAWADIVDEAVYKGSGLRMLYASKGKGEHRPYSIGTAESARDRRIAVHETSIRAIGGILTKCRGGEDLVADKEGSMGRTVVGGKSVAIAAFQDVLPQVQAALPDIYADQKFLACFRSSTRVYLKSSSRYCQNVGREHATSTIYFKISRLGVQQGCFCRKEDHGCSTYASSPYPLPPEIVSEFLPSVFLEDPPITDFAAPSMPSKLKSSRGSSLDSLLKRSRFVCPPKPKQKRKK